MYKAHRDNRFEYAHDVVFFIERHQCRTCVFRNTDDPEYPMCYEIGGSIVAEMPVKELEDQGNNGIYCTKFKEGTPTPGQTEGQESLF